MEVNQQRDDEIELDLVEIFQLMISKMGIIILSGICLALVAIVGTKLFVTPQYQSVTKMYVLSKQNNDTLTNSDLQMSTLLTQDYAELIQSRTVTETVIAELGLDMKHEDLLNKMEVVTASDNRIITIKVLDEDPMMARDIANAIRNTAAAHIKNVMDSEVVNVVDEANIPDQKYSPSTMKNGVIAGFLGCCIAVAFLLIQYLTNDTIKTSEDVERYLGLGVLGTIPVAQNEKKKTKKAAKAKRR